jgi:hypothetical protein
MGAISDGGRPDTQKWFGQAESRIECQEVPKWVPGWPQV